MKIIDNLLAWLEERTGLKKPIMHMLAHPVPPGSKWYYVLGTAIMTSFIVQVITGIALSTLYVPSAGQAFESVQVHFNTGSFWRLYSCDALFWCLGHDFIHRAPYDSRLYHGVV